MASRKSFQAPKGTRDFYPPQMAARRHIESVWRAASTDSGFEEIEGPMFEFLELYTVKSGDGIVSELFSFRRDGGTDDYALRPEFTPTLARMVAAKGKSLALPTKWFAIPAHFRAERPQRGRLREHNQWNVDLIGIDSPAADFEVLSTALLALERLGLTANDVRLRVSHRGAISNILEHLGVAKEQQPPVLQLLDRREKIDTDAFNTQAAGLGLDANAITRLDQLAATKCSITEPMSSIATALDVPETALESLGALREGILEAGLADWCVLDTGVVRGLAYYTGMVFEIFDRAGKERAIAGGGRYDGLVELFGGPPTPACGFGMGDVVLGLVLKDRGLLGEDDGGSFLSRPDAFVLSTTDAGDARVSSVLAGLRRAGLHARRSWKSTRNVGKLLAEAGKNNARFAIVLDDGVQSQEATLKDLQSTEQRTIAIADIAETIESAET